MNDRELLEAAAKAAGIPLGYGEGEYFFCEHGPFGASMYGKKGGAQLNWNPLNSDADALRLAVKLKFDILPGETSVLVFCSRNHRRFQEEEEFGDDPAAATRRAIVRTAASMA